MGLFSKILSGLEVVGGAALMFVPGMQLAGAMLITSGLASSGMIGGSVGKFLNSGLGKGLMAAVALGGMAYSAFGSSVTSSAASEAQGVQQAAAQAGGGEAAVQASQQSAAAVTQDLANTAADAPMATPGAMLTSSGVPANSLVTADSAATNGLTAAQANGAQLVNADGSQLAASTQLQSTEAAASQGAVTNSVAEASGQNMPGMGGEGGPSGTLPSEVSAAPSGQIPPESTGPNPPPVTNVPPPAGAAPAGQPQGWLSKVLNAGSGVGVSPMSAGITAGGNFVAGIGQGILQKQATQEMINAQQWADRTYSDPRLNAQLQASGQAPLTVPQGYLQRAAALKALSSTPGVQPAAGGTTPVPIWQMNSAPRGGMPGG